MTRMIKWLISFCSVEARNMNLEQYLQNPCGASSLPYWKTAGMILPEDLLIVHDRSFCDKYLADFVDEPYFRLYHNLQAVCPTVLPDGFRLADTTLAEYAAHIRQCYDGSSMPEAEFQSYCRHRVYSPELWIAVRESKSQTIVASGIAEFDRQIGEGILEWIQVSPSHRGLGLGTYVVTELLTRMARKARFATVSGQVNNPSNPENLYRKCGFQGNDVWHILRKRTKWTDPGTQHLNRLEGGV